MLKVFINGVNYDCGLIKVDKNIRALSHSFEFWMKKISKFPFSLNSLVEIFEEKDKICEGEIEKFEIENDIIKFSGESKIASKLNSFCEKPINLNENLTLKNLILKLIPQAQIKEEVKTKPFEKEELLIDNGEKTFGQYFSILARKRNVLIIEGEDGNLIITKNINENPYGRIGTSSKKPLSNIESSILNYDKSKLYQFIKFSFQSNLNSFYKDNTELNLDKIKGSQIIVQDPLIKDERFLYKNILEGLSQGEYQKFCNFEIGLQRANAMKYSVIFPYYRVSENKILNINKTIEVSNEQDGIEGIFLIEGLTFLQNSFNNNIINQSYLVLVYENCYKDDFILNKEPFEDIYV